MMVHVRRLARRLAALGLLLFAVAVLLNIVARLLDWRVGRLPGGARR